MTFGTATPPSVTGGRFVAWQRAPALSNRKKPHRVTQAAGVALALRPADICAVLGVQTPAVELAARMQAILSLNRRHLCISVHKYNDYMKRVYMLKQNL